MSSKLKVLQVIPKLGYGGAETGCYDLAHYLHEQGCKSYIVTSGGELLQFINKKKVKLLRLPVHSKNPIIILLNSIILTLLILILNITIVHARSRAPAWSCLIATKITGRKFVTTFHGTYNFNSSIKKYYNSVMLKSNLIIAGSNFIFSHINENYSKYLNPKKKFLVIFRGINTDYFSKKKIKEKDEEKLIKKWGVDKERKIFLLPGRLTAWKGQELFIEALSKLKNNEPNKKFMALILGDDQGRKIYKKKLQRLVEQHRLIEEVKFIDKFNIMPIAYKISDVIFSCSIEPEAFGRVSVEAQSMEKPILASNLGGSTETIVPEKTGWLFRSESVSELANSIEMITKLDKKVLDAIGRQGRKNVLDNYSKDRMCSKTLEIYNSLV